MFKSLRLLEESIVHDDGEDGRHEHAHIVEHQAHRDGSFFLCLFQLLAFQDFVHHVHVRAAAHEAGPDKHGAKDPEGGAKHKARVQEHENPVDGLEERQNPDALDLDVLKAASGNEDSALVAPVQDDEELLDFEVVLAFGVEVGQAIVHPIGEAADDAVLEEVNNAQVHDQRNHFWQDGLDAPQVQSGVLFVVRCAQA